MTKIYQRTDEVGIFTTVATVKYVDLLVIRQVDRLNGTEVKITLVPDEIDDIKAAWDAYREE